LALTRFEHTRFNRLSPASARRFNGGRAHHTKAAGSRGLVRRFNGGRAWLLFLAILLIPTLAYAENLGPGGGTRIIVGDEVVGPYRLLFTTSPEPAQVGTVTFVVRVSDPQTDAKVRDADVIVELVNGETGTRLTHAATHFDSGNLVDYAAHIQIDQAGQWSGTLRVRGSAGTAETTFIEPVLPQRQVGTLIVVGIPFVVLLGVLGGLWLARSASRKPKRA